MRWWELLVPVCVAVVVLAAQHKPPLEADRYALAGALIPALLAWAALVIWRRGRYRGLFGRSRRVPPAPPARPPRTW